MSLELQKPGLWKRIAAWMFDVILLAVLAVGFGVLLSFVTGYDKYENTFDSAQVKYEQEYGVKFELSKEEYDSMSEDYKNKREDAYEAFVSDKEAMYAYKMMTSLSLVIATVSILFAYLALEFAVPMIFKNGQTLGKKCFSFGLMRQDGVKITAFQLFVRTVLAKFTLETMIPVYIIMMILMGQMGIVGTAVLAALLLTQIGMLLFTKTNSVIHDIIAGTVAVDIASQRIFDSTDDLIAYQKKIAAEKAAKQTY